MKSIGVVSRLKIMAVLGAIFYLIVGIADVFVDTTVIDDLIFHSVVFHIFEFIVLWIAAPIVARYVHV
jgi:hypothetical protein